MGTLLLALDVGTSTTRAALVSEDGKLGPVATAPTPGAGRGTLRAEEVFQACLFLARSVLASGDAALTGIGVAAQLGLVLMDARLDPTTEVLLWSDRRATAEALSIAAEVPDAESIAGRRPTADLAGPKLLWLAKEEPAVVSKARWALSLKDYLVARLTGEVFTDESSASYTLLFDVGRRCWSDRLFEAARVGARLLPVTAPACAAAGSLKKELARELGVGDDVVVAVGGPDGSMGVLGAGAVVAGVVVDVAGSTDVVLATTDRPVSAAASRLLVNAYVLPGLWTVGGTTPTTGFALSWLARLLGAACGSELLDRYGETASKLPVGSHGLLVDPALTGPRFPYDGSARSAIVGLGLGIGEAELVRGFAEGIAFSVREVLDLLDRAGVCTGRVRLVGGGSQGWSAQLRADAWQREVEVMSCHEATLVGAAVAAAVASGTHPSPAFAIEHLVAIGRVLEPRTAVQEAFAETFKRWRDMKVALGAASEDVGVPDAEARRRMGGT